MLAEQNLDEITALPLKAKTQRRRKENHKVRSERGAVVNQSRTRVKDISPFEVLRRKALKKQSSGEITPSSTPPSGETTGLGL